MRSVNHVFLKIVKTVYDEASCNKKSSRKHDEV